MWSIVVVGTFTMVLSGAINVDGDAIKQTAAFGGNVSITSEGFKSREACEAQMPHMKQFSWGHATVYVNSVECKENPNTGDKSKS